MKTNIKISRRKTNQSNKTVLGLFLQIFVLPITLTLSLLTNGTRVRKPVTRQAKVSYVKWL